MPPEYAIFTRTHTAPERCRKTEKAQDHTIHAECLGIQGIMLATARALVAADRNYAVGDPNRAP